MSRWKIELAQGTTGASGSVTGLCIAYTLGGDNPRLVLRQALESSAVANPQEQDGLEIVMPCGHVQGWNYIDHIPLRNHMCGCGNSRHTALKFEPIELRVRAPVTRTIGAMPRGAPTITQGPLGNPLTAGRVYFTGTGDTWTTTPGTAPTAPADGDIWATTPGTNWGQPAPANPEDRMRNMADELRRRIDSICRGPGGAQPSRDLVRAAATAASGYIDRHLLALREHEHLRSVAVLRIRELLGDVALGFLNLRDMAEAADERPDQPAEPVQRAPGVRVEVRDMNGNLVPVPNNNWRVYDDTGVLTGQTFELRRYRAGEPVPPVGRVQFAAGTIAVPADDPTAYTTTATTTTTGAIDLGGGVGIAGHVYVGVDPSAETRPQNPPDERE